MTSWFLVQASAHRGCFTLFNIYWYDWSASGQLWCSWSKKWEEICGIWRRGQGIMEVYEESYVVCGDGPYVSSLLLLVARCCDYNICARLLPMFPSQLWLIVFLGLWQTIKAVPMVVTWDYCDVLLTSKPLYLRRSFCQMVINNWDYESTRIPLKRVALPKDAGGDLQT
jgi:hypothetical protein